MKKLIIILILINTITTYSQTNAKVEYFARFINVARAEKQKFGIPISINLGLSALNSDFGKNYLALSGHNYFGIKSFNKKLNKIVFKGISYKKYDNAWESFRDFNLLIHKCYSSKTQFLSKTDYEGWARAIYPQYQDLINLIETFGLQRFDEN